MTDAVRPPLQARTRQAWKRVLDVGLDLLCEGGYDALTISEVCRRARISAPSLYARVDGRHGLFLAVYEHGMTLLRETEEAEIHTGHTSVEDVVRAVVTTFSTHHRLLRAVIARASQDDELLERGAARSRDVVERTAMALPREASAARRIAAARLIYTECAFRAMYGGAFWVPDGESDDDAVASLTSTVQAVLDAA